MVKKVGSHVWPCFELSKLPTKPEQCGEVCRGRLEEGCGKLKEFESSGTKSIECFSYLRREKNRLFSEVFVTPCNKMK